MADIPRAVHAEPKAKTTIPFGKIEDVRLRGSIRRARARNDLTTAEEFGSYRELRRDQQLPIADSISKAKEHLEEKKAKQAKKDAQHSDVVREALRVARERRAELEDGEAA